MSDFLDLPDVPAPRLELAYQAVVHIGARLSLGRSPHGERRLIPILGGSFRGPRLAGTILPGGADRQLARPDGTRELDAFYEMREDDGTILTVRNRALVRDGLPGQPPAYACSTLTVTAPAAGPHDWLNQHILVGTVRSLRPGRDAVLISVHLLR